MRNAPNTLLDVFFSDPLAVLGLELDALGLDFGRTFDELEFPDAEALLVEFDVELGRVDEVFVRVQFEQDKRGECSVEVEEGQEDSEIDVGRDLRGRQ